MVRLREIPRTAAFAWSPGSAPPLIVTGTKAGAVDADFSTDTTLELWDLGLDQVEQSGELQPAGSISTDARFYDIAWSQASEDHSRGIIAGALENGSLDLWDAEKLHTAPQDSFMSRTQKHSGAIKAVQFNHFRNELLATAGAKGELYISDLNNISNPFRLGASVARADDFECLDWNKGQKVPHILATGSSGGFVTVWDVRSKKENLTLNNLGRKAVSAVSWDPNVATRLLTATSNDQDPLILMWDLRNSSAPERTLKGHELGVLSLSWCQQDSNLLLSCGKDNRTICWNPQTGQALGEFPVVTNWTFQTGWNTHNPSLFATASFDGKITVQTIQNTNPKPEEKAVSGQALDGEDFFARAQTQPQGEAFTLPSAPKWLERPAAASFGFGGKLVRLKTEAGTRKSQISIEAFAVDSTIPTAAEKFEDAMRAGDIASICESKIADATTDEERSDWQVIETLNAGTSRKKLREYLGFGEELDDLAKDTSGLTVNGNGSAQTNGTKDDSSFFDDAHDGDNFLADLAYTKGAKTNEPFHIYTGSESDADKGITAALMLGRFEAALDICLKDSRMSDAFMIAICGGQKCIDKVQNAYLKREADGPNYLRLLASIVGKNLWDVVHNADLANWKEVMATLSTFADETEFSSLCEALGDRLEAALGGAAEKGTLRRDASFCYLAGSNLEKVVSIWVEELQEKEEAGLQAAESGSSFSLHARSLQDFIEKVTVFRQVTRFQDSDNQATTNWKLAPLYAKYTEYADILAAHGQLQVAEKYLNLLPTRFPAAEIAQTRVKLATKKNVPAAGAQKHPAAATAARSVQRGQPVTPSFPGVHAPVFQAASVAPSSYIPPAPVAPVQTGANPYAPPTQSYAPTGYQPPQQQIPQQQIPQQQMAYGAPSQFGQGYQRPQQAAIPPPPRATDSQSGPPAPPKAVGDWNDMPDTFFKAPAPSRRNTPGPSSVNSPFPNQPSVLSPGLPPPNGQVYGMQKPVVAPLPPPPKAGQAPPRNITSPLATPAVQERPSSSAANAYAPQQPSQQPSATFAPPQAPPIMRGASPYNPPPVAATGPASNRYAPAPGSQPSQTMPPPRQVAPNPYAPQQAPQTAYGQPQTQYGQPAASPQMGYGQPPPPPPQSQYGQPPHLAPLSQYGQPPSLPPQSQYGQQQAPPSTPYGQPPPQAGQMQPPPQRAPAPPQGPPKAAASFAAPPPPPPQGPPQGPPQAQAPPAAARPAPPVQRPSSVTQGQRMTTPAPMALKYPAGDRSHIPASALPVFEILSTDMTRVAGRAPPAFAPQVNDMRKRLAILFDLLNNYSEDEATGGAGPALKKETVQELLAIAEAVKSRDMEGAQGLLTELMKREAGNWMVGLKRLISMSKATPV